MIDLLFTSLTGIKQVSSYNVPYYVFVVTKTPPFRGSSLHMYVYTGNRITTYKGTLLEQLRVSLLTFTQVYYILPRFITFTQTSYIYGLLKALACAF